MGRAWCTREKRKSVRALVLEGQSSLVRRVRETRAGRGRSLGSRPAAAPRGLLALRGRSPGTPRQDRDRMRELLSFHNRRTVSRWESLGGIVEWQRSPSLITKMKQRRRLSLCARDRPIVARLPRLRARINARIGFRYIVLAVGSARNLCLQAAYATSERKVSKISLFISSRDC